MLHSHAVIWHKQHVSNTKTGAPYNNGTGSYPHVSKPSNPNDSCHNFVPF